MNPVCYFTARWSMRVFSWLWFRTTVHGRENVPKEGGLLLVANHTSHLDPPLVGAFFPRWTHFLARSTLGKRGLAYHFLRSLGTVFVDRDAPSRSSMQEAIDTLKAGGLVLLFPEGTRSLDGQVQDFKRGVELLVRRSGVDVLPLGIEGAFRAMPRGRGIPWPRRIRMHIGTPIPAERLRQRDALDYLRHAVADLAGVSVAESKTEPEQGAGVGRETGASASVRRRSDGPTAASNH